MSSIGEFIKEKREQANYSQATLARKCGLKYDSAVCNIEKGERKVTWEELGMISKVLGNFHVFDALVAAGFISQEDVNPVHRLYHLEELTDSDIEDVQKYIEFLLFKHPTESKEG
ncbi:MAG: helix-turn-helix transcriptional regulator [Lachnospiraceae bacterium]|nr:helix-turn-helix transcriptional regulator [Lachnospiraceae bacterium]